MSVQRSPPGSGASSPYSGSLTDVSQDHVKSTHKENIVPPSLRAKRKQPEPDDDNLTKTDFVEFRTEMMSVLHNFCSSQKEDFKTLKEDVTLIKDQLNSLSSVTKKITLEHNQIKKEVSEMKESINFQSEQHASLVSRVDSLSSAAVKINTLEKNLSNLTLKHDILEQDYNQLQQRERIMNLEISGIPETPNENVCDYVMTIATYANVELTRNDIVHAHRVQPRVHDPKKPKNIVVQLKSTMLKDSIISGIRRKKGITTVDMKISGTSRNVYVNEHLTPVFKQLLKQTKEAAKSTSPKYEYVWVRNCKIFARKDDTSPKLYIKNANDLKKIK